VGARHESHIIFKYILPTVVVYTMRMMKYSRMFIFCDTGN